MSRFAAEERQPERGIACGGITAVGIELAYLPRRCYVIQVGVRHEYITAKHTRYGCCTQCPLVLRQAHIYNSLAVVQVLLLSHSSTRQEAYGVTPVVLESGLLDRIHGSDTARYSRIGQAVLHSRNDYVRYFCRCKVCIGVYGAVFEVETDPVVRIVPTVVAFCLRIPLYGTRQNGYCERHCTYATVALRQSGRTCMRLHRDAERIAVACAHLIVVVRCGAQNQVFAALVVA